MTTNFRLVALPAESFEPLFAMSDEELAGLGARRMLVDEKPGYPCRVSLADAEVGETVLLLPFRHHDVASPYQSTGPIFVRAGASRAAPGENEVPPMFRHRLLSVRAYDAHAIMIGADVVMGDALESVIQRFLSDNTVRYLHVHNAKPGCYNCRVERS
jgi:hypothetical protein